MPKKLYIYNAKDTLKKRILLYNFESKSFTSLKLTKGVRNYPIFILDKYTSLRFLDDESLFKKFYDLGLKTIVFMSLYKRSYSEMQELNFFACEELPCGLKELKVYIKIVEDFLKLVKPVFFLERLKLVNKIVSLLYIENDTLAFTQWRFRLLMNHLEPDTTIQDSILDENKLRFTAVHRETWINYVHESLFKFFYPQVAQRLYRILIKNICRQHLNETNLNPGEFILNSLLNSVCKELDDDFKKNKPLLKEHYTQNPKRLEYSKTQNPLRNLVRDTLTHFMLCLDHQIDVKTDLIREDNNFQTRLKLIPRSNEVLNFSNILMVESFLDLTFLTCVPLPLKRNTIWSNPYFEQKEDMIWEELRFNPHMVDTIRKYEEEPLIFKLKEILELFPFYLKNLRAELKQHPNKIQKFKFSLRFFLEVLSLTNHQTGLAILYSRIKTDDSGRIYNPGGISLTASKICRNFAKLEETGPLGKEAVNEIWYTMRSLCGKSIDKENRFKPFPGGLSWSIVEKHLVDSKHETYILLNCYYSLINPTCNFSEPTLSYDVTNQSWQLIGQLTGNYLLGQLTGIYKNRTGYKNVYHYIAETLKKDTVFIELTSEISSSLIEKLLLKKYLKKASFSVTYGGTPTGIFQTLAEDFLTPIGGPRRLGKISRLIFEAFQNLLGPYKVFLDLIRRGLSLRAKPIKLKEVLKKNKKGVEIPLNNRRVWLNIKGCKRGYFFKIEKPKPIRFQFNKKKIGFLGELPSSVNRFNLNIPVLSKKKESLKDTNKRLPSLLIHTFDALLLTKVLSKAQARGIKIKTIHDAFLVKASQGKIVRDLYKDALKKLNKINLTKTINLFPPGVKYKLKQKTLRLRQSEIREELRLVQKEINLNKRSIKEKPTYEDIMTP